MIPTYRNMDSYPFLRNQIPSPHYYHPTMEPIPPQMTKSPFLYEQPWPYATNYAPHFCYDHHNFPGYYGQRPCYPHVPHTYSGGCPLYGEPFSAPYSPQSYYSMELPRYEYDKYMPMNRHCCGCHNHVCNQKEDKTVKIEEQEPNIGKKENDSTVPTQFRNFPYPLVWIPPEYYGDRQPRNPTKPEVDVQEDKVAHDKKHTGAENVNVKPAFEPRLWNGWFPFDVNGNAIRHRDNMKSESGRVDQKDQSEEQKRSEIPFPFIWLPYMNKQEEDGRTNNQKRHSTTERVEGEPHTFKSFPVMSPIDEGVTERINSTDVGANDRNASDVTENVSNQRNIPVKQIESNHVKNDSKVSEKREMNVSEVNEPKKDSHSVNKRQSTSSPKGSKLPPVCLRVDPLPRKKNGNGSSRSPSPPASKEHSKVIACEARNTLLDNMADKTEQSSNIQNVPKAGEEVTPKVRSIEVSQNIPSDNMADKTEASLNIRNVPKAGEEVTPKVKTIEVSQKKGSNTSTSEDCKKERRGSSDADAAVLIQAVYRGYLVRKWEPLKKLRQIAEVSKEVTHVRDCVKAFEGSSDFQNDGKKKIAIGETIMRLLLKLDTIQGLLPSLREIRKSLARELVCLQERLDSAMPAKYPQKQMQEFDTNELVEVSPTSFQNEEHNQEHQEEIAASQEDSYEVISNDKPQVQFYMKDNDGGSESSSHERTNPTMLLNRSINKDIGQVVADEPLDSTSSLADKTEAECKLKSEVIDKPIEVDKLDMTVLEELPLGVIDEDIIDDSSSEALDSDMHEMKVLPQGLLDEDTATSEETNTSGLHPMNGLQAKVLDEDVATSEETNTSNMHAMKVLPVGVLDEGMVTSEATNTSESEVQAEKEVFVEELPVGLLDEDVEESKAEISKYNAKDIQLEKSLVEEKEEVKSSEESDGWVKIELQTENDELKADAPMNKEESGSENENENEEATPESPDHGDEEACLELEGNDEANILLNEKEAEGNLVQQETKVDAELNGDMKLLEENEKLRKLMKELLEAGNEQLSVISNLTGRVKDLEKKLAKTKRSKKVRTKRPKPVSPKMPCSNNSE